MTSLPNEILKNSQLSVLDAVQSLRTRMHAARGMSGIAAPHVELVAASKGQEVNALRAAITAGVTHFGENRVQEADAKWPALRQEFPDVTLHLIGPLQTNKVRDALRLFDVIETLDRVSLAEALAREQERGARGEGRGVASCHPRLRGDDSVGMQAQHKKPLKIFIQINTGEEPQKSGIAPRDAEKFIRQCREEFSLPVVGLMCVPPANENPALHFGLLYKIARDQGFTELSMGMSGDFETAIRFGATQVRVGTALFGSRI